MDVVGLLPSLDSTVKQLTDWSPAAFGVALAAGLLLAFTPSNFALAPALVGILGAEKLPRRAITLRAIAFVAGIATTFGSYGLVFAYGGAIAGRIFGPNGFVIAGAVAILVGLQLLGVFRLPLRGMAGPEGAARTTGHAYLLGIPFGLAGSACPCSTPIVLSMLLYAGATGQPWLGAAMLFIFGIGRGLPLLLMGLSVPWLHRLRPIKRHAMAAQKVSGALLAEPGTLYILWRLAA